MGFKNGMRPVHPGEVLSEEYLKPLGMSVNALAKALHLSPSRVNDIVLERRGISADTAVRLERYFGSSAQFWLNLQSAYDLRKAERSAETRKAVRAIEPRETGTEPDRRRVTESAPSPRSLLTGSRTSHPGA